MTTTEHEHELTVDEAAALQADVDSAAAAYDPVAELTVDELTTGSRALRASLVLAITQRTELYERALAVTLWLHARRRGPGVELAPFLQLTFQQLSDQLSELGAVDDRPTTPTP